MSSYGSGLIMMLAVPAAILLGIYYWLSK